MLSNSNVFILLILIKHAALFGFTLANSVGITTRIDTTAPATTAITTASSASAFDYSEIITAAKTVTTQSSNEIYGKLPATLEVRTAEVAEKEEEQQTELASNQKHYEGETIATAAVEPHSNTKSKHSPNSVSTLTLFPQTLLSSSTSPPPSFTSSIAPFPASQQHIVNTPNQVPLLHNTISHNDSSKSELPSSTTATKGTTATPSSSPEKTNVNLEPLSKLKLSNSSCNNSNKNSVDVSTINSDDTENGKPTSESISSSSSSSSNANGISKCNDDVDNDASNRSITNIENNHNIKEYNNDTNDNYNNRSTSNHNDNVHVTNVDYQNDGADKPSDGDDADDDAVVVVDDEPEQLQADEAKPGEQISAANRLFDQWPDRSDAVYFVVAVTGGEKVWSRTLARTLSDMGPAFSGGAKGPPLRPIYIDLPANGRFSVNVLLSLCQQAEARPLAGLVVIGNGQSAHAVALSGTSMQLPVLWAKGGTASLHGLNQESSLQALLQPSAVEILEAVRALFLQTHWHSFFVLSDAQATIVMSSIEDNPLKRTPLVPTVLPMPRNSDDVFKQLAQISRSTRGVILLFCDFRTTRKIMSEAQRLNMVGGHFIWLWIDTGSDFDQSGTKQQQPQQQQLQQQHQTMQQQPTTAKFQPKPPASQSTLTQRQPERQHQDMHGRRSSADNDFSAKRIETDANRKNVDEVFVTTSATTPKSNKMPKESTSTVGVGGGTAAAATKTSFDSGKAESFTNGEAIVDGKLLSENENIDFSAGFDPFRVHQHQDEHLKRDFGAHQHYKQRNTLRDKQLPVNRLILGLRSESSLNNDDPNNNKKNNSNKSRRDNDTHQSQLRKRRRSSGGAMGKTETEDFYNANENGNDDEFNIEATDGHSPSYTDEDDEIVPVFFSNLSSSNNNGHRNNTATNNTHNTLNNNLMRSKHRNFSGDNLFDYFIDNNNFNENHNLKLNFKRTSASGARISNQSIFVNFHQFKDFPVGLLALRPMRMNVDRYFIREAVHVFATTWQRLNDDSPSNGADKSNENTIQMPSLSISSLSSSPTSTHQRAQQNSHNRNAPAYATLFNAKKMDGQMHSRKMRRKRNINTVNELLMVAIEKRSAKSKTSESEQQTPASTLVNSSRFLDDISRNSDKSNINNNNTTSNTVSDNNINNYNDKNNNNNNNQINNSSSSSANKTNNNNISNDANNYSRRRSRIDSVDESMILNSSFTSDLTNKHKDDEHKNNSYNYFNSDSSITVNNNNSRFNQNLSGLWKQNSKNMSNNVAEKSELVVRETSETVETATGASATLDDTIIDAGNHASQAIVQNFFAMFQKTEFQPKQKRSAKKEITPLAPNKRPQQPPHDATNKFNATTKNTQFENVHHTRVGKSEQPEHHHHQHQYHTKIGTPHYLGGCYGEPIAEDVKKAEYFARALREATKLALSGYQSGIDARTLTTHFELLNLVPTDQLIPSKTNNINQPSPNDNAQGQKVDGKRSTTNAVTAAAAAASQTTESVSTKWRRVGLVSASSVRLDTIVWPGGDIVVSGLSARARTVFRIVTALAPPFVMESELDEDGLCLRGLPCHRVSPVGRHNLTLMFNAIETRDRLEEDAVEHGNDLPPEPEHLDEKISHVTKCCYGLSMDLLDNVATELGFEFHLYVVRDQLFGSKQQRNVKDFIRSNKKQSTVAHQQQQQSQQPNSGPGTSIGSSSSSTTSSTSSTSTPTSDRKASTSRKSSLKSGQNSTEDLDSSNSDKWNGIIGDLIGGSADMSFAPLSVSKARAQVIDFSIPYFHSGVSLLASPKTKSEIPLLAFLLPFSPELWIAIFTSLNITAVAVAVYEWLSPFGLNPWGRQRSKNFSLSSALWVMWGLLCGHLVAFKAPKSWPNKFLINVWGGFSVIFVASYTANIAALIAGLFFHHAASSYDSSLATQRVGAPIASAAESYVQNKDRHLWEHMKKYSLNHIEDGIRGLKNGTLDLLMADSPILDYYRATDHGCSLQRIGETFVEDTYAIGMVKGFPLKESISALIAKYSSNGYLDILTEKWYGGLPCFKYESEIVTPRPLGVAAVAGVFLLLGMGMVMGVVILIFEHWFYKYALPSLRLKPKGTIWKSRNIMFFSQKLYRFINCVELVSPHHAARELVHSIRQGQIASLFQKSIKRKEDEQRRRRKSKAQFFEMIQEIRRAQQVERENLAVVTEADSHAEGVKSPPSIFKPKASPKPRLFSALKKDGRSRSNSSALGARRYSTDSILGDRMDQIGRRLSRDLTNSPPIVGGRRFDSLGKEELLEGKFDTISGSNLVTVGISKSNEVLSNRYDTFSGKNADKTNLPIKLKKTAGKRPKISFESYHPDKSDDQSEPVEREYELPSVKEGLEPAIVQEDRSVAILRHKLHKELRSKYPPVPAKSVVFPAEIMANRSDVKPPIPRKNVPKHQRQKSLDNLEVQTDQSQKMKISPLKQNANASSLTKVNQRSQVSLERLSREDLLRLSHSSQSEIHEYLNKKSSDRPAEPP